MRCKKHPTDLSSSVGVCSSCLRERLFTLLVAQAEAQAQSQEDRERKSDTQPPPLVFPRSVSPYISRRKSDIRLRHDRSFSDHRFYSTPQVGSSVEVVGVGSMKKKKHSRLSLFFSLFRSQSEKMDSEHGVVESRDSDTASSLSPSWFSKVLSSRRKRKLGLFSVPESTAEGNRGTNGYSGRGMSPVRHSDGEEDVKCHGGLSGYSSESSQGWRQTPMRSTPAARRCCSRTSHSLNMSELAFCLSPLVRASPSRQWKQKGMPPDLGISGEIRAPPKSHLSNAASFCKSRSRKLADYGRSSLNR